MYVGLLILLAINAISFLMFALRKELEETRCGGLTIIDELAFIFAIGGMFGAFIAMKVRRTGLEEDKAFRIAIPFSMIVQASVIIYLFLYDLGVVK